MLKSSAGGGGIGMQLCTDAGELRERFAACSAPPRPVSATPACSSSASSADARHVEVQIFGDGKGRVVALGERDCSLQRRNQKVLEETPAPGLPDARAALHAAAVALGAQVAMPRPARSSSSTTRAGEDFYFLEVNTRLQVEHPVTEAVLGIDLVEWMIRQAAGEDLPAPRRRRRRPRDRGRGLCREPQADFRPSAGVLTEVRFPARRASTAGSRPAPR